MLFDDLRDVFDARNHRNRVQESSRLPPSNAKKSTDSEKTEIVDHISDARQRAREMLSGELHLGHVDDWRRSLVSARDGVTFVWLVWVSLYGLGLQARTGPILVAVSLGVALYIGISTSIATRVRLRYHEEELDRERHEIEERPEQEREEVRALYAAKGFEEPLLTQVTDILCADDDRLLKVMMEEELGLFIGHINHPLLVGLWNFAGAAIGGLVLATPACFQTVGATWWMIGATISLLVGLGATSARVTGRDVVPVVFSWLFFATVTGGATLYTAQWLAGVP